ncbi:UNKNOWN [Stylonychia lemnae]|uniref:Uncharacterized protein n=1 Tax=Stylonychia lemnae TaxID=5949 RepID=A0A078B4C9_STYLE|nr:UNKNOWN [Stylonychia lemnae]|eukprot:CDW89116.1 UNKNOWN [Stylonychia lemnae]
MTFRQSIPTLLKEIDQISVEPYEQESLYGDILQSIKGQNFKNTNLGESTILLNQSFLENPHLKQLTDLRALLDMEISKTDFYLKQSICDQEQAKKRTVQIALRNFHKSFVTVIGQEEYKDIIKYTFLENSDYLESIFKPPQSFPSSRKQTGNQPSTQQIEQQNQSQFDQAKIYSSKTDGSDTVIYYGSQMSNQNQQQLQQHNKIKEKLGQNLKEIQAKIGKLTENNQKQIQQLKDQENTSKQQLAQLRLVFSEKLKEIQSKMLAREQQYNEKLQSIVTNLNKQSEIINKYIELLQSNQIQESQLLDGSIKIEFADIESLLMEFRKKFNKDIEFILNQKLNQLMDVNNDEIAHNINMDTNSADANNPYLIDQNFSNLNSTLQSQIGGGNFQSINKSNQGLGSVQNQ